MKYMNTVYSGYSGHVYSGHLDIVAPFPGTKSIYSIIFRSDIVARKGWPKVATISEVHYIQKLLYMNIQKKQGFISLVKYTGF